VVIFIAQGAVHWPATWVLPADAVRGVVIVAGAAMTGLYAWKYWL